MPKPSPADGFGRLRRALAGVWKIHTQQLQTESGDGEQRAHVVMQNASGAAQFGVGANTLQRQLIGGAMEHIRKLSRALEPSPVRRTGLKNALLDLAEAFNGVTVRYTAAMALPPIDADGIYRAIANSVAVASRAPGVTRITISVSGSRSLAARVEHNGRQHNAEKELAATALLARHAGLSFEIKGRQAKTRQGTIVVIQYAGRRPTGG